MKLFFNKKGGFLQDHFIEIVLFIFIFLILAYISVQAFGGKFNGLIGLLD